MITVTRRFDFEAAHKLPNYKGKCHNLHGHTFFLDITVRGTPASTTGMVIDFGLLKQVVEEKVINVLDHQDLNEFLPNPTCELLITYVVSKIIQPLRAYGVELNKVRLYEGGKKNSWAEWSE